MYLCETGQETDDAIDTLAIFVSQARALGVPIAVHRKSLPEKIDVGRRYDLAPFVTDISPDQVEGLFVIGEGATSDLGLRRIQRLTEGQPLPTTLFGTFENEQCRLNAAARLSYALGRDPIVREIAEIPGLKEMPAPLFGSPVIKQPGQKPRISFIMPDPKQPGVIGALRALATCRTLDVSVIAKGSSKSELIKLLGGSIPIWHLSELLPRSFASRIDIAILCDAPLRWYRLNALFANCVANQTIMVDATDQQSWSVLPDGIIPASLDGHSLLVWLQQEILPTRADIAAATAKSKLNAAMRPPVELTQAASKPSPLIGSTEQRRDNAGQLVFMPTNGVGLGHAKRCSLVARELEEPKRAVFAAFPSCLQMINNSGFDAMPLVSKSEHRTTHANDLVNHTRLNTLCDGASGLVFDGGYVFDSIVRSAVDNNLPAVWIRRGLWQAAQNNSVAEDRQKIFRRIVVPAEAFDELNHAAPHAENAVEVGPILQHLDLGPDAANNLRKAVFAEVGQTRQRLVVTMLGGGVAADRRAQINTICAHLGGRPDVLNLLVIWPTAITDPAWFTHENTAVVQTYHASTLIAAADLLVSAAGYNSFHEALYGAVPTIFIPQMASYMDDQRARARSASERELSILVEPWETLKLGKAIDECLEGRTNDLRQKLRSTNLPPTGNGAAARAIEEVCR
ncbi:MAG: glycosyltransferase [Pseudomonadota bacterium]